MERITNFIHRKLDYFSFDEYLIIFVLCSFFLPFYCSVIAITMILFYLLKTNKLSLVFNKLSFKALMIFAVINITVCFFYHNYEGLAHAYIMIVLLLLMLYYRQICNRRLFELLLDLSLVLSWFAAGYALMEYSKIIDHLDYNFFSFVVEDSPKYRINATFMNANYYAMMIEFLVLISIYKMMQMKQIHRIVFYMITILLNLFVLYLSGCRSAWIPFIITIPVMFIMNKRSLYIKLCSLVGVGGVGFIAFNPSLLHRASSIVSDFLKRGRIWDAAIHGIQDHLLFGCGPRTYHLIYKQYQGHPTYHAHNVYLETLLSHGLIGTLLLGIYFFDNIKEIYLMIRRRIDVRMLSLIFAFILTLLLHGILDATIYWSQTAGLFLLVINGTSIYFKEYTLTIER